MTKRLAFLSALSLVVAMIVVSGGAATASQSSNSVLTSTSLGTYSPTFVGSAATGCAGCSLLSGPTFTPSTANLPPSAAPSNGTTQTAVNLSASVLAEGPFHGLPSPALPKSGPDPTPPTVNCQPLGPGCDAIGNSSGGATGVRGLNAVDSGTLSTNPNGDIEPADQGLCAGNGYVVEDNNIGEILVLNANLHRLSSAISLDTVMGLTAKGWSSGGDISCLYDASNGGHWFFTEIVSDTAEDSGGTFAGCFSGAAGACYEGIAVTVGSNPYGPYNVYYLSADYNPNEPGSPNLLNDFAKISVTQDAFLLFYDEFPLIGSNPGIGGGYFNGAQEFAFNKSALESGQPVTKHNGSPNPDFTVAIENMSQVPSPDGTCAAAGTCWYQVIPAQPADQGQFDNSHGGSGFMLGSLDFYGSGDTRFAVFDWTGLSGLNSQNCSDCGDVHFGGQLFSGVEYYYGEGFLGAQKAGPIPLGDECGAAGLSPDTSCPENGIATNGDGFTQVAQSQGQIWAAVSTAVSQTFSRERSPEVHQGAAYWVIGTSSFDRSGVFTLTSQGYVSAAHEDLEFPAIAALGSSPGSGIGFGDSGNNATYGSNQAIMAFTLSGNGGPTGADHGGYYPSTAFGRLNSGASGLAQSTINVVDLGQAPEDGFSEYVNYGTSSPIQPRWGDYSWAVYMPGSGQIYFATNYIQYPNCTGSSFTPTSPTCGGTRDFYANWGTSVNSVTP